MRKGIVRAVLALLVWACWGLAQNPAPAGGADGVPLPPSDPRLPMPPCPPVPQMPPPDPFPPAAAQTPGAPPKMLA